MEFQYSTREAFDGNLISSITCVSQIPFRVTSKLQCPEIICLKIHFPRLVWPVKLLLLRMVIKYEFMYVWLSMGIDNISFYHGLFEQLIKKYR